MSCCFDLWDARVYPMILSKQHFLRTSMAVWTKKQDWGWFRNKIHITQGMKWKIHLGWCDSLQEEQNVKIQNRFSEFVESVSYYEWWGRHTADAVTYHSALMRNVRWDGDHCGHSEAGFQHLCLCMRVCICVWVIEKEKEKIPLYLQCFPACLCVFSDDYAGKCWVGGLTAAFPIWSSLSLDALIISSFILSNLCRGQWLSLRETLWLIMSVCVDVCECVCRGHWRTVRERASSI